MWLRFERHFIYPTYLPIVIVIASFLLAFTIIGLVFIFTGISPVEAYKYFFLASFADWYCISELLVKTTPLLFTGLAVLVALKMHLWNIGAEGQLFMGAFGATWAAYTFSNVPTPILVPIVMLAGMATGALWGLIPALLKIKLNVSEVLTSLLLNYIAISWVLHLIYGTWGDPLFAGFPQTPEYVGAAKLPQFFGTRVHLGLVFGLVLAAVLFIVMKKTTWGYEIDAIGACPEAANYAGMHINRDTILTFLLSGAIAGLAGMSEIAGLQHKLQPTGVSSGYGYIGIIIAWLSNGNPIIVILVAVVTAVIFIGVDMLQIVYGLSSGLVMVFEGTILIFLLAGNFFTKYKLRIIRS